MDNEDLIFRVGLDCEGNQLEESQDQISRTIFNEVITTGKGKITADAASSVDAVSVLALNIRSVMIMDLDHFKQVNDTYGHLAGDQELQAFAQRTLECVREVDVLLTLQTRPFTRPKRVVGIRCVSLIWDRW